MSESQAPDKVLDFVRAAKAKGVGDDSVVSLLRQNGWSERRVYDALSTYYEEMLGTSIPARGTRVESARDAFYYLLAFITLGCWTVALVLLADQYVDHVIPDVLGYPLTGSSFRSEVAGQLATLIIAYPLFLLISRLIAVEVARRPEALESGVRKWLTYIALVITAVTLLGDAVWFLTSFLTGDLTARFAWKAIVLFVVAAGVFSYYLATVRTARVAPWRDRLYATISSVVVVLALVLGFTAAGTPSKQRELGMDEVRMNRISSIAADVSIYWTQSAPRENERHLPRSLFVLPGEPSSREDPQTSQPFEYHPGILGKYSVCAVFDDASEKGGSPEWAHPAGRHCFALDAHRGTL
ncbi:MAG: hypothetical protein JO219_00850 [Candidatus Eremiobacteraeota bacterium]|nr:hypothetical protein [Candidatus Eremiobacteraeota bacterium]MBV8367205.1 hypothetical protein [Candidatus Eremiobacteraeota bacterium]